MSGPTLDFSPESLDDLAAIATYIAERSGAARAGMVTARIIRVCHAVALMPGIGRVRDDLKGAPRVAAARPWLILYEPVPGGDGVIVQRVVDGRRDLAII